MNKVVSIRLSDDMLNTTNKLIAFKIVNSRTDAINYIMEHGINNFPSDWYSFILYETVCKTNMTGHMGSANIM